MRIKKIKLAGFKSFVDPTAIPVSSNLIGIVGPNGCGKSNVIDAVRWVMGESSAKHLRGDSMTDVIFSGSTARKPVGKAMVELVFDNGDGRAPGQYASYAEIAIRREASRDGQSDYFINKTRCRRKDITDIFLGTGLGPRAYSIIEQGMVTRIIEAKPEDLRAFVEEAAGVSKFKERRRETENRIRHTRENLARVEDIRKELETQLNRLQRQSKAAAKYKEYKQQERLLRAQLLALRWQSISVRLQEHDGLLSAKETEVEAAIAGQRGIEAAIESIRSRQIEATDHFNDVQGRFYAIGAEISNIEQAIQHAHETHQQRVRQQEQLARAWAEAEGHLHADQEQLARLRKSLEDIGPRFDAAQAARAARAEALSGVEQRTQALSAQWEQFTQAAAEPEKVRGIQRTRIAHLDQHAGQLRARDARLGDEAREIEQAGQDGELAALRDEVAARDRAAEAHVQALERLEAEIQGANTKLHETNNLLQSARGRLQSGQARAASLRELQAAALGKYDAALNEWLEAHRLEQAPRLAKLVSVEPGWEKAVERVLSAELGGVCLSDFTQVAPELAALTQSDFVVFDRDAKLGTDSAPARTTLLDKVESDVDLAGLLSGVYVADTLEQALAMRAQLVGNESIVTRDGVWIGRNWLALANEASARAGMIARERELEALGRELVALEAELEAHQAQAEELKRSLALFEAERADKRRALQDYNRERAALHAKLGQKEAAAAQLAARAQRIAAERAEIATQLAHDGAELAAARQLLQAAETQGADFEQQRTQLSQARDAARAELERARSEAASAAEALHRIEVERQGLQTGLESTQQSIGRLEAQLKELFARRAEIDNLLAAEDNPERELKGRLESLLQKRLEVEVTLNDARKNASELDAALREREQARGDQEQKVQAVREALEHERMARQELAVRGETVAEQLRETGFELQAVVAGLPAEMTEETGQRELDQLLGRIDRLGPINLVAIEEYEEQSQRKGFLDRQYEDLSQALNTLEEAIHKIDRETRTLFKETFDKINTGFQSFFPRLFGGGHAYLELVGDDILTTGVSVMARPPGKRNSTIHLLSGGEKALTAVALLFAIFELNPAPFCLLDEVDAPLDDANVERYSETLKAMSRHTQLIYITHNKISMEIADVLLGVTMSEPGVSRLVAVDVEEAMEMVAQ